ncbi:MAG: hypothetical protein ACYC5O_11320 [Anaerolineae bacterium]
MVDTEQELLSLSRNPKEQMLRALSLLGDDSDAASRAAALTVLGERAGTKQRALRPVLLALYDKLDNAKKDPGGYLRTEIIRALRPSIQGADVPLLQRAAVTYDFGSYGGMDVAGALRAEAAVVLAEVEPRVAGAHAVHLLLDPHTDAMSGEPALTAVKILVAGAQALALYTYLLQDGGQLAEVTAECLKHMVHLPAPLAALLARRYLEMRSDIVHVGVVDMVIGHDEPAAVAAPLFGYLAATKAYDVYHYAVTALVAGHNADLLAGVLHLAERELDHTKRRSLAEALALVRGNAAVDALLEEWGE